MAVPPITGYQAPGVYPQDVFPPPAPSLLTGVPAFLGYTGDGKPGAPYPLTLWPQFKTRFGVPRNDGFLGHAVRGFFENGGLLCYVVPLDKRATPLTALRGGLTALHDVDAVDLVCAPDIMAPAGLTGTPDVEAVTALQAEVLADCRRTGGRFAILDAVPTSDTGTVERQRAALDSRDGALYHPWLWAPGEDGTPLYLPPCGHVAGIYARSDQQVGVHKAPANEAVEGVLDLRAALTDDVIGGLYAKGVNSLRVMPGRGIRVWGARTLSGEPGWQSIGARRVFLTMGRWLERFLTELTYEPNGVRLWVRIMRELTAYLDGLFRNGALKGHTPEEAFFVKCDSETNPPDVIEAGMVVTNIGVALAAPAEFVVVRIIHGTSGVSIQSASATV
ncbi:phage tail sheath family protein [Streptosporangium sp. NPDC000509]|uniref:phage tail sheath family protein n=1 Tax=Streptosporangium sp. NPDC000509 TaxID=3366186 RepID=UPI0036ACB920